MLLGEAACLVLTLSAVSSASATTTGTQATGADSTATAATASPVCTVRATAFVKKGNTNVVTATATECDWSAASDQAAARPSTALANVHVGYGCDGSNFSSTCWYFDVPSPGCSSGSSSWGWDTISQNNRLSSWEAVGSCSHGVLYDLPIYGGAQITCYTCYSLGSMDNKATSLKVFR
jgi:hypothetical protein